MVNVKLALTTTVHGVLIYERLKELGQLDNLKEVRPPKDYSKQLNPRRLDANKKASAEA